MRSREIGALFVVLLAAGPVAAQDKPPAAPELRLVPAPGKPVGFRLRFESSSTATTSGERAGQPRVSNYEMSLSLETGAADASGALPVTLRVERVTGKAERMGLGSFDFDSESALPDDFMRRDDVFKFTMLAGTHYRLTVTPDGAIAKVEGLEDARKFAAARGGVGATLEDLCASIINDASVSGLLLSVLGPAPYPKGPATKSTKWTDADRLDFNSWGATYEISRQMSVTSAAADAVRITGRGTVKVQSVMNVALLPLSMAKNANNSAVSDWTISPADGLPVAGKETLSLDATLAAGGKSLKASHRATFSVARLAAPPAPAVRPKSGASDAAARDKRALDEVVARQVERRKEREADRTRGAWAVSADGSMVAAGNPACDVEIWRPESPAPVQVLKGHTTLVRAVAIDLPHLRVFACAEDGTVRTWSLKDGTQGKVLGEPNAMVSLQGTPVPWGYNEVSCSPDGRFGAYIDMGLDVWDSSERAWMKPAPYVSFPQAAHFLSDSRRLLVYAREEIAVFDLLAAPVKERDVLSDTPKDRLRRDPLWKRRKPMFGGGHDAPDDMGSGDVRQVVPLERAGIVVAIVTPEVLSKGGPTVLRAWALATGEKRWEVTSSATSLVYAPQAPWIGVRDGGSVKLLSPADGKVLRALPPGPQSRVPRAFAPDGSAWYDADATGQLVRVPIVDPDRPKPPAGDGADKK